MTKYAQEGICAYEQSLTLYELALSVERPPQPLPVSPATLLSIIGAVIDLLVEQQISATLWSKLPSGEIWQAEIHRYHQQVAVSNATYTYNMYTENSEVLDGITSSDITEKQFKTHPADSPIIPVQLPRTSQLKREYFLLVLSPRFSSLILAHRPRSKQQNGASEKNDRKKQPLLTLCSFEGRVIQRVLDGIRHAIEQSAGYAPTASMALDKGANISVEAVQPEALARYPLNNTTPADLLANWDSRFVCVPAPDPVLLSQFLLKQIQLHDEIRQSASTEYANTTLQLQNQELLNTLGLKDELLSNLCQELRTPLTNMKTALSLLNSSHLKPAQRQRYMQLLNTECDRQNSLITGLLELVQLDRVVERKAIQPVYLSEIVPGVVSTYQPLAQEKGLILAYTVPTELPAVSCLDSWVKQIVINLLHNSIKFTSSGGQVWVRARPQSNYVHLEFRDTGIGIAPHEIPKIFDRFYRVRPVASEDVGGAGLGLTIVQELLSRCGGSIAVKSKLGEGSTFNVLLPVATSTSSTEVGK